MTSLKRQTEYKTISQVYYTNMAFHTKNSINQILNQTIAKLQKYSNSPTLDAEIIITHAIGKDKNYLYTHLQTKLNLAQIKKINQLLARRLKNEPIAYITGQKEFYKLNFELSPSTLIPRPETETVVSNIITHLNHTTYKTVLLDIGTGCGCIIISVLKNINPKKIPAIKALSSDISPSALKLAKTNAKQHKLLNQIKFIQSNLLDNINLTKELNNYNSLIIAANLPYLPHTIYQQNIQQLKFEPSSALIAKQNGLAYYIKLIHQIKLYQLALPTTLYFEILPQQTETITKKIKHILPGSQIEIKKDLNGQNRVIKIINKSKT